MTPAHNGPRVSDGAAIYRYHTGGRCASLAFHRGGDLPRPQVGGGIRGVVRGFSKGARRRLMRRIASVNRFRYEAPPAFLTLTYPREYPDDPTVYRGHARAFLKRLRRRYGDGAVVWRLEFQRRGAPHFHMLLFDFDVSEERGDEVRQMWFEVVGSGDQRHARHGTDLQRMRSWSRVTAYLSKYIAKRANDDGEVMEPVGRWWGVESGQLLHTDPVEMLVRVGQALKMRRAMQRFAGVRRRSRQRDSGFTAFVGCDAASRLGAHHGARPYVPPGIDQPPTSPDQSPDQSRPDAGLPWRLQRHAWVGDAFAGRV